MVYPWAIGGLSMAMNDIIHGDQYLDCPKDTKVFPQLRLAWDKRCEPLAAGLTVWMYKNQRTPPLGNYDSW